MTNNPKDKDKDRTDAAVDDLEIGPDEELDPKAGWTRRREEQPEEEELQM